MVSSLEIENDFLATYLEYVDGTEPPHIYHLWSIIACVSAALGRRCWFPFGMDNLYPNQYVLLVGPPGSRKSTALKIASKLLRESTGVRFAPDDTSGQRQGMLAAMSEVTLHSANGFEAEFEKALAGGDMMQALGGLELDARDPTSMFVSQSEFTTFLGNGAQNMTDFLIKLWDGETYDYKLKNSQIIIKDAVLNILGATTADQIARNIPAENIGGGFTSRFIFVHAAGKRKKLWRPPLPPEAARTKLQEHLSHIFYNMNGAFMTNALSEELLESLYNNFQPQIKDPRFIWYEERRFTHLLKLCMALAATYGRMTIQVKDVELAHSLLSYTESFMSDALGEFGLNKLSAARNKLLEFLQATPDAIDKSILYTMVAKDMSLMEFNNAINDFMAAGKIQRLAVKGRGDELLIGTSRSRHGKNLEMDRALLTMIEGGKK